MNGQIRIDMSEYPTLNTQYKTPRKEADLLIFYEIIDLREGKNSNAA
jgi:hypothetical protein